MNSERASDDILWAALGEAGTEVEKRAVVAAFALIAAADGTASAAEVIAFQGRVNQSRVFEGADHEALWSDYANLAHRLVESEATVMAEIEDRLVRMTTDADRAVVIAAARLAIVADGVDSEREEAALAHIARLIGAPTDTALLD